MFSKLPSDSRNRQGFSLIEVVLAIGIFLVTVLALVGLLGPTLQSVDEVEKTDEIASVVNTVNAFLQNSPDIAPNASKFDAIYNALANNGSFATIFVFRQFEGATSNVKLTVGFDDSLSEVNSLSHVTSFADAAGPIYRVVLSPSSVLPTPIVTPEKYRSLTRVDGVYELKSSLADYEEGYFAMEVRIFVENPPGPGQSFDKDKTLADLAALEPMFTYNTAVVR